MPPTDRFSHRPDGVPPASASSATRDPVSDRDVIHPHSVPTPTGNRLAAFATMVNARTTVGGSGRAMSSSQAFWIDEEYDREHATSAGTRYGEQVSRGVDLFAGSWGDIAPVSFACVAWQIATPPLMSPGYVRWHRRVLDAGCVRNEWDGGLTARVTLVSPWPAALAGSRHWAQDRGWRGWQDLFGQFVEPTAHDLARVPFLRASLLVEAPLPLDGLPTAPEGPGDDLVATARRAVIALVRELNALLTPVIRQIEAGAPVD